MESGVLTLKNVLSKPMFGFASLGGGSAPSVFGISTPELQYWALFFGVIIGGITAILKIQELWEKVLRRK